MPTIETFDSASILADVKAYKEAKAKPIRAEIARLQALLAELEGEPSRDTNHKTRTPTPTPKVKAKGKGKRLRRSPEELEQVAKAIHAYVTKAGKEGVSGGDIRKGVQGAGLVQQLKAFVEEYGGGKLKTTGQKSKMQYFAA